MSGAGRSADVLRKLLNSVEKQPVAKPESIIEDFLKPAKITKKKTARSKGRPAVADKDKARNFTLCLAKNYLDFLDGMKVKDPKVQGRGRKIRFIIDRFLEHERRQLNQMKVLKRALLKVEEVLKSFAGQVKKGEKLSLTSREKAEVDKAVSQVETLTKLLNYSSKELHRMLPSSEWAVMSFCLDWRMKKGINL